MGSYNYNFRSEPVVVKVDTPNYITSSTNMYHHSFTWFFAIRTKWAINATCGQ